MNNIQLELKLNIVTEQLTTYLVVKICTPKISLITFSFEKKNINVKCSMFSLNFNIECKITIYKSKYLKVWLSHHRSRLYASDKNSSVHPSPGHMYTFDFPES